MYRYYNPNPYGKKIGDCVIRGISYITNQTWDETYWDICIFGFLIKDMPSSNQVWEDYLTYKGYERGLLPRTCPNCYTVRDFCVDYPFGTYLLTTGSHVVAVQDGCYYDAWDSGDEVPVYCWFRERS